MPSSKSGFNSPLRSLKHYVQFLLYRRFLPQRRGLHLRAVYCYALVQPRLATSLDKIKVAKRIDEAVVIYGREEIDRVLAPLVKPNEQGSRAE